MNVFKSLEGWNDVIPRLLKLQFGHDAVRRAGWCLSKLGGMMLLVNGKPCLKLRPVDEPKIEIFAAVFDESGSRDIESWTRLGGDSRRSNLHGPASTEKMLAISFSHIRGNSSGKRIAYGWESNSYGASLDWKA